jgi:hypothetical protein
MVAAGVARRDSHAAGSPATIMIDDPAQGSIFPPDTDSPTFAWRDPA